MLSKRLLSVVPLSIRTIRKVSARLLEKGMTFQQYRILLLTSQGHSQTEMSEILQVSMAAVSKMADVVIKKKFVVRVQGKDKRCAELKLTASGKKIVKNITTQLEKHFDNQLKTLTKKELTHLGEGFTVLEKLMGQMNEK